MGVGGATGRTYPGVYRGVCVDPMDPEQRGRIQAQVPSLFGTAVLGWANPCVSPASKGAGVTFDGDIVRTQYGDVLAPLEGDGVWIMFENGDPESPVWMGVW